MSYSKYTYVPPDCSHLYPMAKLIYIIGDATQPVTRPAIIIHACNDQKVWGAGFVMALSAKWTEPERVYRQDMKGNLSEIGGCAVADDLWIINMIVQKGTDEDRCIPQLAFEQALGKLYDLLEKWPSPVPSIHCPRIGSGLGRTPWPQIERALAYGLPSRTVYVYDLPGSSWIGASHLSAETFSAACAAPPSTPVVVSGSTETNSRPPSA